MSFSEPETRHEGLIRIAKDDYEFRMRMLTSQTRIETLLESHIEDDRRQFNELRSQFLTVSSSVGSVTRDRDRLTGMQKVLMWLASLIAVVGGWLINLYGTFRKS